MKSKFVELNAEHFDYNVCVSLKGDDTCASVGDTL